jgi:hypothetical protein
MEQSGIPAEALEGETQASQQEKWEAARRATEKKAKKAAVKREVRVKKKSVISGHDFVEMRPHFVRGRVGTHSSTFHEVPATPLPSSGPQDRKPAKKGSHANPPGSQRSRLPSSPFLLPEGSPPLQDFELPKRITQKALRWPTVKGMETSSDEESQGKGDPPPECCPARGPYRLDSPDDEGDSSQPRQSGHNPAQISGPRTPADRRGDQGQTAIPHQVFALLPQPKHTRFDIETDILTYHKGEFPIYSGCQPEEGGFNPYMQAAYEAEERRLASIRASLDEVRRAARVILPGKAVKEPWRPGFFKKTGTLPGGSLVTLSPKGVPGTDSVTAMFREASHPDHDHLFSQTKKV